MCRYTLQLVLFLVISPFLGSCGLSRDQIRDIENYAQQVRECRKLVGLTLGVVHQGDTVLTESYGMADLEKNESANASTPFAIGSLTKGFTSVLLAMLLQDEQDNGSSITWDTPVRVILGDSFHLYDNYMTREASLKDLLAHKMSLYTYDRMLMAGFPTDVSRQEIVRRMKYLQPAKPFRSTFVYNNFMYALAGYVAEKLADTGATWEELVKKRIFMPLKMMSSGFVDREPLPLNMAQAYVASKTTLVKIDSDVLRSISPLGPAGSIYTTSEDMAKWIQFLLSRGRTVDGKSLLGSQHFDSLFTGEMAQPFSWQDKTRPTQPSSDISVSYALGWALSSYRGYTKVYHTGLISTYDCALWIFPDMNSGLYLCTNGPARVDNRFVGLYGILTYASDLLLGETPWISLAMSCAQQDTRDICRDMTTLSQQSASNDTDANTSSKLSRSLTDFVGTYSNLAFGHITVYINVTTAVLHMKWGHIGHASLEPYLNRDVFKAHWIGIVWFYSNTEEFCDSFDVWFSSTGNNSSSIDKLTTFVDFEHSSDFFRISHGIQNS